MTRWTAIVPLKPGPGGKSRLATVLSPEARQRLAHSMADHVIAQLSKVEAIGDIAVIADRAIPHWPVRYVPDRGRGLNAELDAAAVSIGGRMLVIHGDLPSVSMGDIAVLLEAAEHQGAAVAPDRHLCGTNVLALRCVPPGYHFAFGNDSFARHRSALPKNYAIVVRDGLGFDIDMPEDFEVAVLRGWISDAALA